MGISICYIAEAGCTGMLPSATSAIQPALVISALIVDLVKVPEVTNNFIKLKVKYFPGQFSRLKHDLEALMVEIKGADVRADLRRGPKQKIQQRQKFLDDVFALLDNSGAKLVSRIWIKGIGQPFNGRAIYTTTAQRMAALFQNYLKEKGQSVIRLLLSTDATCRRDRDPRGGRCTGLYDQRWKCVERKNSSRHIGGGQQSMLLVTAYALPGIWVGQSIGVHQ